MKRKSRKFNKPISGGSGGFSLNGAGRGRSAVNNSAILAARMKQYPIVCKANKHQGEEGLYIHSSGSVAGRCVPKMADSGTSSCISSEACYRERVETFTKSPNALAAHSSGEHTRNLC